MKDESGQNYNGGTNRLYADSAPIFFSLFRKPPDSFQVTLTHSEGISIKQSNRQYLDRIYLIIFLTTGVI